MKKNFRAFAGLLAVLTFSFWSGPAFGLTGAVSVPEDSGSVDKDLALDLLELCTMHTGGLTEEAFRRAGFEVKLQANYDRPTSRVDHSSAYTVGKGAVYLKGKMVPAFLVTIRGTDGTEWLSNFDFSFSASDDGCFADNFLASAEDVFLDVKKIVGSQDAVILVAGHSRGGAVANLAGLLLNQVYDSRKIYVYTFATPATVRNLEGLTDGNIFNFINPCDVVPRTPPVQFGFRRVGTDVMLDDESLALSADKITAVFDKLGRECPDIEAYYNKKIDVSKLGLNLGVNLGKAEMTFYQIAMMLGAELSKMTISDEVMASQGVAALWGQDGALVGQDRSGAGQDGALVDQDRSGMGQDGSGLAQDRSGAGQVASGSDQVASAAAQDSLGFDGSGLEFILREHMPARYKTKLLRWQAK